MRGPLWIVIASLAHAATTSSSVQVSLQASWSETPLLVEILESLWLEDPNAFFPLLGALSHPDRLASASPESIYKGALALVSGNFSPAAQDTLSLSIANRETSPKIQAFYEFYDALDLSPPQGCDSFVVYNRQNTCDGVQLTTSFSETARSSIERLPFDHATSVEYDLPSYVLYGDPHDSNFHALHTQLYQASLTRSINYVLRWKPRRQAVAAKLAMSGYGAGLDVKKSDYLALDDRQTSSQQQASKKETQVGEIVFGDEDRGTENLIPLMRPDLKGIGEKVSQFITASSTPLDTLVHLASNFPKYAHQLVTRWVPEVSPEIDEALATTRTKIQSGQNLLWLNGARLTDRDMEPFVLIRRLREEGKIVQYLVGAGLTNQQAVDVLSHPALASAMSSKPHSQTELAPKDLGLLFDASDDAEQGLAIVWWNNLEKDRRYKHWPDDITELGRSRWGQLPQARFNVWNLVFLLDLGNVRGLKYISQYVMPWVQRGMPFHMGMVPLLDDGGISTKMARLLLYVYDHFGKADAVQFTTLMAQSSAEVPTIQTAKDIFDDLAKSKRNLTKDGSSVAVVEDILKSYAQDRIEASRAYARRLGVERNPHGGVLFFNGRYVPLSESIQSALQTIVPLHQAYLQQELYYDRLTTDTNPSRIFYDLPTALKRRNTYVFESESRPLRVDRVNKWDCPSGWVKDNSPTHNMSVLVASTGPLRQAAQEAAELSSSARWCLLDSNAALAGLSDLISDTVIVNGRVLTNLSSNAFSAEDFSTLVAYEAQQRAFPVREALLDAGISDNDLSYADVLATAISILVNATFQDAASIWSSGPTFRDNQAQLLYSDLTSFSLGNQTAAWARFEVALDPISELAAKWSSILAEVAKLPGVVVHVHLNPSILVSELPIKRFYRQSFASRLAFAQDGSLVSPSLVFQGMPTSVLLTLGLDTPKSWLAFPSRSVHDLDNIRLADLGPEDEHVEAVFELESIIVEGHCRDVTNGHQPPRGLQLVLSPRSPKKSAVGSIVMANLGYVQLKANPGLFNLAIREKGRGRDVFEMTSSSQVALTSFEGATLLPTFVRKPGQEASDLLSIEDEHPGAESGIFAKVETFFRGKKPTALIPKKGDQINVFTVASGLLYERMALIMIVSVLRHTETPVKFWFISNFLSPSFKSFIPHMAAEYQFDYELVTYKWPHWLRAQKEKQRTIWGYKILFLDVLFPLELDRVIFVDSDQASCLIVRTDLKQLVDLDLMGAPYAYTPMCDSRKEMDGFRFWRTGYWRDHLRGKPYHISALYVIDLDRFRQIAAGDRLRGQYQGLSADPNSLANLDQDLPNNMQDQIPIFTLDQSWLWCQTWCDDESLKEAKTIDLCNNPMTHEPKLLRAKRLIPEWTEYDTEIAELAKRIAADTQEAVAFEGDATGLGQAKQQDEEFKHEGGVDQGHIKGEL